MNQDSPSPEEEAARIISSFMHALDDLEKSGPPQGEPQFIVHAAVSMRDAGQDPATEEKDRAARSPFIPLFFANAPRTRGNALIAERKSW